MDAMDKLKSACKKTSIKKTYKSFKDINIGEYNINRFAVVDCQFGKRIRIDLDEFFMYLPERFVKFLTDADIDQLNEAVPKVMVYSGKDAENKDRLILDFKDSGKDVENEDRLLLDLDV